MNYLLQFKGKIDTSGKIDLGYENKTSTSVNTCTKILIVQANNELMTLKSNLQRSQILFEESIHSKYTKMNYTSHLNQFMKFTEKNSSDQLLHIPTLKLQRLLEDYLIDLKQTTNPNTLPSLFRGIKHFCVMNGINLNWNIIHKMFPQKQKTQNLRACTADEIKILLSSTKNIRNKALIHFLASTGARIGVFDHDLLVRHIRKMPHGCIGVLLYADHIEEYWTFLTPQASRMLKQYHDLRRRNGESFYDDTPIFTTCKTTTQKQLGWSGVRSVIYRMLSSSGITRYKQDKRYDVQADHGFRKRFNTILKLNNSVNYNIAEKLMGHKNGLDGVYLTPTLEELFLEFIKVMRKIEI